MIRIITVDDHPVVRRGVRQIIETAPEMQVAGEAENGREALDLIRRTPCDIVVLDINLPDASGLEILGRLQSESPALPVLIMSIHDEELYALRALKAGAAGYLMKNSIPEELIKAVRKIVSGGRYISPSLAEKLALGPGSPERPPHERLSEREFQILCRIASGKPLKAIGLELCLSAKTISTYRARILEKMGMKSNAELVGYAIRNRLTGQNQEIPTEQSAFPDRHPFSDAVG